MKQKLLKTMLLLSALVAGTSMSWATADVEYSFSSFSSAATVTLTPTSDITITLAKNDGSSNPAWSSSQARVYAKGSLTISSKTKKIASIVYTYVINANKSGTKPTITGVTGKEADGTWNSGTKTWTGSATEVTFATSGTAGNVGFTKVEITYEASYTITLHANNDSWGSVEQTGVSTITATPTDGYRVKKGTAGYTLNSGTASITNNENSTFTITPSTDCDVTINFEAIPYYSLSSAVSPVGAGTVTLGATSVREGSTTTASVAANAGYKFTSWSISGTGASLSSTTDNPTTVTMGTANATVTANFEEVTTHAIKWSVNGSIVKTENVEEDAAISFDDPASGVPTGYTFKGWVVAANRLAETTNTDPSSNYVTSATSTEDITYYAVLAIESPGTATWTLDYTNESSLSASTSWGSYGTAYEYTATDGSKWIVKAYKSSGMQINTGKNSSIKIPTCSGNIQSIVITCSASKAVGLSASDYTGSETISYLVSGTDATSQTLDLSAQSVKGGYIVPKSGSTSITKIVVTYSKPTYSHYCTTVVDLPVTVTSDSYATFASELPIDFSSSSIKAYIAKAKGDKSGVTFTSVNKVPANTGVLLYKDGGASEYIPVLTTTADDVTGNVFVKGTGATVATDDGDNYNYILNKVSSVVGFYRANDKKVAANRAYISIPKGSSIKEFFSIDFEDDADGIDSLTPDPSPVGEGCIYNLAGQKLSKMQKGINIVNGKKIMK